MNKLKRHTDMTCATGLSHCKAERQKKLRSAFSPEISACCPTLSPSSLVAPQQSCLKICHHTRRLPLSFLLFLLSSSSFCFSLEIKWIGKKRNNFTA